MSRETQNDKSAMEDEMLLYLTGKLLLAMPGMQDPRFDRAVIYLCAHSDDGAMGLIVNKPNSELRLADILQQLEISPSERSREIRVHFGGPVEHGRGFVLHSPDYDINEGTITVGGRFCVTATVDIIEAIAEGNGPQQSVLTLGYAGWGPGQLEEEIKQNGWLISEASEELIFEMEPEIQWGAALERLGVNPAALSGTSGRA